MSAEDIQTICKSGPHKPNLRIYCACSRPPRSLQNSQGTTKITYDECVLPSRHIRVASKLYSLQTCLR